MSIGKPVVSIGLGILVALSISACSIDRADQSGASDVDVSPVQQSESGTSSQSPSPTSTTSISSNSIDASSNQITIRCDPKPFVMERSEQPDFSDAWELGLSCWSNLNDKVPPVTDLDKKISDVLDYDDVGEIYARCASTDRDTWYLQFSLSGLSQSRIARDEATLMLCPDHPFAGDLADKLDITTELLPRIIRGDGDLVGSDIRPGVYVANDVEECYWERLSSSGATIANDFVVEAPRVEVKISGNDYAFESEGCGVWIPADFQIPPGMLSE